MPEGSERATKRPTIRDVAALAGVSKSLVSLVYSKPESVSETRRKKVLDAAKQLGYTPNFLARSLAAEGGTFVGLLVEDLHNPFIGQLVDFCRAELEAHGEYGFVTSASLLGTDGKPTIDQLAVNALIDLRPKGIIAVGTIPQVENLKRVAKSIPIICASDIPVGIDRASSIRTDDEEGLRLSVDHLVAQGHRHIYNILGSGGPVTLARNAAYERAMLANGLEKQIRAARATEASEVGGYQAALELLKLDPMPSAITCYSDIVAVGAQQALQEHFERTGSRIALTGYDNTYLSRLKQISLTSVEPQNELIAKKCIEILLEDIKNPRVKGREILVKPYLVVRASSAFDKN